MSATLRMPLAITCLVAASACESQVTPEYQGESLLSLVGSVTISEDSTEGELIPALAFENLDIGRLDIVEVEAEGEFPNNFSLFVHAPPPASALMHGPEGEPRFALGYVTAVTTDHPEFIPFSYGEGVLGHCDDEACYEEFESCTPDRSACYRETRVCDPDHTNCRVTEMSGDPSIQESPWRSFAGLSSNYRVLYLDAPALAGSLIAAEFAQGQPLAAGYHLLSVRSQTEAESAAAEACYESAQAEVLAGYNEAHGTAYERLHELGEPCPADGSPCVQPDYATIDALYAELDALLAERGCRLDGEVFTPIEEPAETPIQIHIEREIGPFAASE